MLYFLGIDMGTSGLRFVVLNPDKQIVCSLNDHYTTLSTIKNNRHQQQPELWWKSFSLLIKQLKTHLDIKQIQAIAIDGTSGTIIAADKEGNPLYPALMYNDARAQTQAAIIAQHCPADFSFATPYSGLAKIMWLNDTVSVKPTFFFNQADWLLYKLSGQFYSDSNNALKMGYDPIRHQWPAWMKALSLDFTKLPEVVFPGTIIEPLTTKLAQLGFADSTVLVAGTTDSTAAIMASGAKSPGDAISSLGSTLVTKIISPHPVNQAEQGIYSQPYGKNWLVGGSSNSGGNVIKHYFSDKKIDYLSKKIYKNPLLNLNYYPLLNKGERFPVYDPDKEPVLEPKPQRPEHFLQAIFEGIADIENTAYQLLEISCGIQIKKIISMGGGAENPSYTWIREAKSKHPCIQAEQTEAAVGMACLAAESVNQALPNPID